MSQRSSGSLPEGISVVIPVYCSALILSDLINRLEPVLMKIGGEFEVILVNDGSSDESWQVIQRLAAEFPWICGVCMMRSFGQHNALLAGIREARFDLTVTMDDDLQHPPEGLPMLVEKFVEGYDVVYAPPIQEQHGIFRNMASVLTKLVLQGAMGADTARMVSAWRIFRTDLRDGFSRFNGPFVNIDVLLTWSTTCFGGIRLQHDPRTVGKSNYGVKKLVVHALNMMTGFSVIPLQIASVTGFVFTLFGVGVLTYVIGRYCISGSSVAGFPFLASVISIFSGAQLFALGIMGEYLARIHFRTMEKPSYSIRVKTDG
jgi:glycosyltransferase involved in cell wall biosynthesis